MRPLAVAVAALLLAAPALARKPRRDPDRSQAAAQLATFSSPSGGSYQFSPAGRASVASGATLVSVANEHHVPTNGWFPLRVSVDNTAGPTQRLTLTYRSSGRTTAEVTRVVELVEGERRTVTLPVSSQQLYGQLRAQSPVIGSQAAGLSFKTDASSCVVLALGTADAFEAFVGQKPNNNDDDVRVKVVTMAPDEAPTELAAYLGFSAVALVDPRGLDALSEAQRAALEGWVATGGSLALGALPAARAQLPLLPGERRPVNRYGLGHVSEVRQGADWGKVPVSQLPVEPQHPEQRSAVLRKRSYVTDDETTRALLPQATVPVGRFLFIITLFTLVIGPGSALLARRRGTALLLATIPLTALVTSALMFGSSVLLEGLRVHVATSGFTLLDREGHRAITVGLSAWYANLAPRGVALDGATALIGANTTGYGRGDQLVSVEWRDGARLGADFVPPRVYREWGVVSVSPSRARLLARRQGDGVVLQNALGVALETAWVQLEGELYVVSDVRDGGEATMRLAAFVDPKSLELPGASRFTPTVLEPLVLRALDDGEFLARVKGRGFVPTGGVDVELHDATHVVRGEVEP
ncbi:MAG: hypothetical protein INH41_23730 [Myxococcaceae bacterium]|nr:hypothetical protein [Myxococcaceae bacterium]